MKNPFTLGLAGKGDFCDREKEMEDLLRHAKNGNKTVLFSPRRYGKSSLISMVLDKLSEEGFTTIYVDLFPITSEKDFISRLSEGILKGIGKGIDPRTVGEKVFHLFKRLIPSIEIKPEGYSFSVKYDQTTDSRLLLEDLLEGLYAYTKRKKIKTAIALDEFQEITELPESKKIEGILRSHIQSHREIAYFFIGSRRRILNDMFLEKSRAFYKSAFSYILKEISRTDFVTFIIRKFRESGKVCDRESAEIIYDTVRGYPYYVQKLASITWDLTSKKCNPETVFSGFKHLLQMEVIDFEGIWSGLTLVQRATIKAIAKEPGSAVFSKDFLERYRLSIGGTQKAVKILISRDLVEKDNEKKYRLTDPVMAKWLRDV
ncbi:MAG: ATP-binding protein [Thermodesulfobacteriota bacterium]